MQGIGKLLVIVGLLTAVLGGILWLLGNRLNWFGHLPGDVRIEKENFKFYAPIASMLLLSLAVSIILWLIGRFFK